MGHPLAIEFSLRASVRTKSDEEKGAMALFSFRVRNQVRDRENDAVLLRQLVDTLKVLGTKIDRERKGLQIRYRQAAERAAFSMQALENEGGKAISGKVDDLTNAMTQAMQRILFLQDEIAFIEDLRVETIQFARTHNIDVTSRTGRDGEARSPTDGGRNA